MTAEVFVSYAHRDHEMVLPLVEQLQAAGVSLWIDQAGIAGATLWSHEIVEAIEGCEVFLLMLSQASAASEQVVREVHLGSEARKPILPLILEPVTIPRAMRYPLAGIQHLELFRGTPEERLQTVLHALEHLGIKIGAPPAPPAEQQPVFHNLPQHLTRFIGREQEVAEVKALLMGRESRVMSHESEPPGLVTRDPRPVTHDSRLVTVTGPGGTGKTRMSLQVGMELAPEFADGVYFISLVAITEPDLVVETIAQTLGVTEEGSRPLIESLKDNLRTRQALLLLDNFEQVLPAAGHLAALLAACPDLRALVTSRELLRIRGEHELHLPPLELPHLRRLPPVEALARCPSVELFVERAAAVKSDFELTDENARTVAEICVRLDGLPLAIELAAARVKLLPPQAMLARLENRLKLLTSGARDLPERHRTLRGAIDWSHDLLSPEEQTLFRRLAIFAGSFTLETAETICGDVDVLEALGSLVDKSLVRRRDTEDGEPRFFLLGTIREYALERLAENGELEALQGAHAAHYLALAEESEPRLRGREQGEWLARLELEHDNLRAALDWSTAEGRKQKAEGSSTLYSELPLTATEPSGLSTVNCQLPTAVETALRLGAALWRFWHVRGYPSEGRERLEAALTLPGAAARSPSRARALNGAGALAHDQGAYALATALLEEALAIAREVNASETMATALNNLGHVELDQGRDEEATAHYQEALGLWRELGNKQGIAMVVHNLGSVALDRGDYSSAAAYFDESLALKRQSGDQRGIATSLNNLGMVMLAQGTHERAAALLNESLRLFQQLGDNYGIAMSLRNVADLVSEQGNLTRAAALHRRCLHHCTKLQNRQAIAASLEGLAGVIAAQEHPLPAARLYGAAEAMRESLGAPLTDNERATYDRKVAAARARADAPAWDAAWQQGRAMPLPEVFALAAGEFPRDPLNISSPSVAPAYGS